MAVVVDLVLPVLQTVAAVALAASALEHRCLLRLELNTRLLSGLEERAIQAAATPYSAPLLRPEAGKAAALDLVFLVVLAGLAVVAVHLVELVVLATRQARHQAKAIAAAVSPGEPMVLVVVAALLLPVALALQTLAEMAALAHLLQFLGHR